MIGFCLVGGGFIGPLHAANIAAHPGARLAWVVDVNLAAAEKLGAQFGARATASLDDALADPAVQVVMICTPPRTHAALIERAARAGKAIFCEKPVDLDIARVDACARLLATTRTPFFVGFNRRFDPTHRALYDAIRAGEIGQPEMLLLSSRDPEISPPDYVAQMPYGIFYDTMIHDFDMVRWLLADEIVEVFARVACMLDPNENPHRDPDTAMVQLRMQGLERHDVHGTRQDPLLRFFIERYADSYRRELDQFVAAIAAGTPPPIGIADGRAALEVADAAVASAKIGAAVALQAASR